MKSQITKISDNCWKHVFNNVSVFYRNTSNPESELHREDGPAVEFANGDKAWYYHGQFIDVNSQEEFEIYIRNIMFI